MKTYKDYKPETRAVLTALIAAGFALHTFDDGDSHCHPCADLENTVQALNAVDEAHLYVKSPEGKRLCLFFVFGNGPGEL